MTTIPQEFVLDGKIKIEVKASRVVNADSDQPLYVKALSSESEQPFWMNFQQIKPDFCDVFVWIAVWRDQIKYWILSSQEVQTHPRYSTGQHRGNSGEGQIHVRHDNIQDFTHYEVPSHQLASAIRQAYTREMKNKRT